MNQATFTIEVLGMLGSDYEAPRTIASDLSRDLGRPVTEVEVRAALVSLALKGWAQAALLEASTGRYAPIEGAEAVDEPGAWFMATLEGMAAYENAAG
jgi:hypothetical protein